MSDKLTELLNGPAGPAPSGVDPQLDDPPNQRAATYFLAIFSMVFTTFVVGVRLITRGFVQRTFGFPEYTIFLGYGLYMAFCAECIVASSIAAGMHSWNLRLKHLEPFLYSLHIDSILYGIVVLFIKLSIMAQFLHFFTPHKEPRSLYWSTIGFMGINGVVYTVLTCLEIWACSPVRKAWNPLITEGHCLNISALNVGAAAVNVTTDVGILVLPQTAIWRLQMPFKTKAAYASIFMVAILSIAAATARLAYSVVYVHSADVVWYTWILGICALVELDFAFLCACMPAVPAFARWASQSTLSLPIFSYLRGTRRRTRSGDKVKMTGPLLKDPGQTPESQRQANQPGFYTRAYGSSGEDTDFALEESPSVRNV